MKKLIIFALALIALSSCSNDENQNNIPNHVIGRYKMVKWESSEDIDVNRNGKHEDMLVEVESAQLGFRSDFCNFMLDVHNSGDKTYFSYTIPKVLIRDYDDPHMLSLEFDLWTINSQECYQNTDKSVGFKTDIATKWNDNDSFETIEYRNDTIIINMTAEFQNLKDPRFVYLSDITVYYKKEDR
ncbi:membrane lipoprotein lipid attachment site-containing protein [Halosquirtibacter xylanolyticus]|uniref:membrane lipoprotein lipid attachment site-containing protein n=1 Tax=Halosquirtibacter xylanolyticus TaxID=3374599 RepID=UPI00374A2FE0|nr:membrane lipoprotein lipid attachment site-containing protein [Prolixibacteraceae bacterium]